MGGLVRGLGSSELSRRHFTLQLLHAGVSNGADWQSDHPGGHATDYSVINTLDPTVRQLPNLTTSCPGHACGIITVARQPLGGIILLGPHKDSFPVS